MKRFPDFVIAALTAFAAGLASAQPYGPAPPPQETPAPWYGPAMIPLLIALFGLFGLIIFVAWRMVARIRRQQRQRPRPPGM